MQQEETQLTFTETARRAQIIQSAIATINELGYHRASLAEIAKRTPIAKSAIVYYFGSKDALLLDVLEEVFSVLGATVEGAVAREVAPEGRLRADAETYLEHISAHRDEVAAGVTIVISHRGADGIPLYPTTSDEDTALLRSILSDGMAVGVFRQMPLPSAVTIVESTLDIAITAVQQDLQRDLTTLNAEIISFIFHGLT